METRPILAAVTVLPPGPPAGSARRRAPAMLALAVLLSVSIATGPRPASAQSTQSTQGTATPPAAAATPVTLESLPAPKVRRLDGELPHRVLFVGNSYFYYNDSLHNHVRRLVDAADPALGKALAYKSATIGGSPLAHHPIDHYLTAGSLGQKEPWDLVILQDVSNAAMSDRTRARYDQAVDDYAARIRKADGRVALYLTHAYVAPHKAVSPDMDRRTADLVVGAGNRVQALVLPVGPAFAESYRRRPGLSLHQSYDGSHPSLAGTYLAACVVYASLYGRSPVGNAYDYYGRLDRETVAYLQQVAADVVDRFLGPR